MPQNVFLTVRTIYLVVFRQSNGLVLIFNVDVTFRIIVGYYISYLHYVERMDLFQKLTDQFYQFQARFFRSDGDLKDILKVVDEFRKALENLTTHNEIHIPLVYTQIVVIAVYSYCLAELFTTSSVPNENCKRSFVY